MVLVTILMKGVLCMCSHMHKPIQQGQVHRHWGRQVTTHKSCDQSDYMNSTCIQTALKQEVKLNCENSKNHINNKEVRLVVLKPVLRAFLNTPKYFAQSKNMDCPRTRRTGKWTTGLEKGWRLRPHTHTLWEPMQWRKEAVDTHTMLAHALSGVRGGLA